MVCVSEWQPVLIVNLHIAGNYDRVLENTFGVRESPAIYFGQDSGNPAMCVEEFSPAIFHAAVCAVVGPWLVCPGTHSMLS